MRKITVLMCLGVLAVSISGCGEKKVEEIGETPRVEDITESATEYLSSAAEITAAVNDLIADNMAAGNAGNTIGEALRTYITQYGALSEEIESAGLSENDEALGLAKEGEEKLTALADYFSTSGTEIDKTAPAVTDWGEYSDRVCPLSGPAGPESDNISYKGVGKGQGKGRGQEMGKGLGLSKGYGWWDNDWDPQQYREREREREREHVSEGSKEYRGGKDKGEQPVYGTGKGVPGGKGSGKGKGKGK